MNINFRQPVFPIGQPSRVSFHRPFSMDLAPVLAELVIEFKKSCPYHATNEELVGLVREIEKRIKRCFRPETTVGLTDEFAATLSTGLNEPISWAEELWELAEEVFAYSDDPQSHHGRGVFVIAIGTKHIPFNLLDFWHWWLDSRETSEEWLAVAVENN
jgi:hypothetical protein